MKNLKQILSFVLVLLLALSSVVLTASAEDFVPSEEPVLYFEVPEDWNNVTSIFCHIWSYGGDPLANWQSKKERCTETDTPGVYSYDITAKTKAELEDGVMYCVIFSADTGMQTYDLLFSTECFGDTAYCDGTTYENPEDSSKTAQAAFWRHQDSFVYGPVLSITSIGNITGTALPPNVFASDLLYDFLTGPKLDNARTYSGKSDQEIIDDLAQTLKLSKEEVANIITLAGVEVDWSAGGVSSGDEASRDENAPLESTTDFIRGDADMDGTVNIKDATYIQKAVAGLETMSLIECLAGDADTMGDINIKDATAIQKFIAGIEVMPALNIHCRFDPDTGIIHIVVPE
ncbi:MAG: hypothetical protein IJ298_00265 [Ruminococcus sp.]|nr:hypothetical protein [Ruminococcus sp.]